MPDNKIARNIRAMRCRRGITQAELASRAGVSGGHLCECESGKKIPSLKLIQKLANVLDCRVSELIDGSSDERSAG